MYMNMYTTCDDMHAYACLWIEDGKDAREVLCVWSVFSDCIDCGRAQAAFARIDRQVNRVDVYYALLFDLVALLIDACNGVRVL